jgi:hypothetical protein
MTDDSAVDFDRDTPVPTGSAGGVGSVSVNIERRNVLVRDSRPELGLGSEAGVIEARTDQLVVAVVGIELLTCLAYAMERNATERVDSRTIGIGRRSLRKGGALRADARIDDTNDYAVADEPL